MDGSAPSPPAQPLSWRSRLLHAFHASRKPPSIVKSVLAPDPPNSTSSSSAGWPPFNGNRGTHRLGELDLAFLSSYFAGMYVSGHAADHLDIRRFLAYRMFGSCIAKAAFGLAYWLDVHRLWYFVVIQVAGGLLQSIGWPCDQLVWRFVEAGTYYGDLEFAHLLREYSWFRARVMRA